jgi:hypothetical protein
MRLEPSPRSLLCRQQGRRPWTAQSQWGSVLALDLNLLRLAAPEGLYSPKDVPFRLSPTVAPTMQSDDSS